MREQHGRTDVGQHPRRNCYFCGSEGPIQTHHIVPQRYDGSDSRENLVDLCPTCHERLERLYNRDFYDSLGVDKPEEAANEAYSQKHVQEQKAREVVNQLEAETDEGARISDVISDCVDLDPFDSMQQVEETLSRLRERGEVYEPVNNHLRTT